MALYESLTATGGALQMPIVTTGCGVPAFKVKSFPVPRKLFDCFTAVVHVDEPHAGAVAGKVNVMLLPGMIRSEPTMRSSVGSWSQLSFVAAQLRVVGGLANEKEVFKVVNVGTVHPDGILICAEPNPCPPGHVVRQRQCQVRAG